MVAAGAGLSAGITLQHAESVRMAGGASCTLVAMLLPMIILQYKTQGRANGDGLGISSER